MDGKEVAAERVVILRKRFCKRVSNWLWSHASSRPCAGVSNDIYRSHTAVGV